jgi:uncharacterized membrane protein
MDRLRNATAILREQLWALPAVFTICSAGLAYVLLTWGDRLIPSRESSYWWLYSGEARTARDLLSSLLSGLMTMTSLVVSVTFVILTLAANQLGPRLISTFLADRQIKSVLGLFIGTILYLILIMRTLDDTLGSEGVPHVAVTAASLLTILCLLALLFYIHKIARLIISDTVVEAIAGHLVRSLQEVFPQAEIDQQEEASEVDDAPGWVVAIDTPGYLQVVDYQRLLELAAARNLLLEVKCRAGNFILRQGTHVVVRGETAPDQELKDSIRKAFTIGAQQTPAQDPEHNIRQLVEIAIRALSPGINDPFTAKAVLDRLGAAFEEAFARALQPSRLRDRTGVIRVVAARTNLDDLLGAAFHPIRQAGAEHPAILISIAETITKLSASVRDERQRAALAEQLERLAETASLGQFAKTDERDILDSIETAKRATVGPMRRHP